jgi:hypothetical protein
MNIFEMGVHTYMVHKDQWVPFLSVFKRIVDCISRKTYPKSYPWHFPLQFFLQEHRYRAIFALSLRPGQDPALGLLRSRRHTAYQREVYRLPWAIPKPTRVLLSMYIFRFYGDSLLLTVTNLKIVSERPVPQHFEECVMVRIFSYIFQVWSLVSKLGALSSLFNWPLCLPPARIHFWLLTARLSLLMSEFGSTVPRKTDLYWGDEWVAWVEKLVKHDKSWPGSYQRLQTIV